MTSIYEIESGGKIIEIEGDRPPTKAEADKAFGLLEKEEVRSKKQADRAPQLEKASDALAMVAKVAGVPLPAFVIKSMLSDGGAIGDTAADVVPAIGGAILGGMTAPVTGPAGAIAGGGMGGAAGNAIRQAREYFRGERDDFSEGQAATATALGAIPAGKAAATVAGTVAKRAAQGAGLGAGAAVAESVIDTQELPSWGEVGFAAGAGLAFGGALGGLEKGVPGAINKFTPVKAKLEGKPPEEAAAILTKEIETAPPEDKAALTELRDFIDAKLKAEPPKSAAESAEVLATAPVQDTMTNAQRAADFDKDRVEELQSTVRMGQLEGGESIILGDDVVKNQLTALDTRPGAAAAERAKLQAQADAALPKVDDGTVPKSVKLSPQAQRITDEYGFVSPALMSSLSGGILSGATGFATGDDPLDRVKRGLTFGVMGLAGGYMIGKRFMTPSGATPLKAADDVLKDVDGILTPPTGPTLGSRLASTPEKLRSAFITRFASLDSLEKNVREVAGAGAPNVPISRKFEQIAGSGGKAMVDVKDFENAIMPAVKGNERDFDRLLFLKRTGQRLQADASLQLEQTRIAAIPPAKRTPDEIATMAERSDRRRVADWDLAKVDRGLAQLEAAVGPKRFAELDQTAAGTFQQELDRSLQLQVQSGRISQASYAAIKASNDFYAPFRVLRTLEDIDAGRVVPGIDTQTQIVNAIKGIDDQAFKLDSPTKAAAENIFAGRILADKNLKMQELAKLADMDPSGTFIRKLKQWEQPRKGLETVNYFEDGKAMKLEVEPQIAEAIKGLNAKETGLVGALAQRMGAAFRFGATSGNLAFQARNIAFADQPRLLLMSKYGLNAGDVMNPLRVPMDFAHGLLSSLRSNLGGTKDELARAFYESGAAGSTLQDSISNIGGRFTPGKFTDRTGGTIRDVIGKFEDLTRVLEETTKMMGFKRALRIEGVAKMNPAQRAAKMDEIVAEIRNFAGSPDFARGGGVAKDMSMLTLFFNARIQGTTSDLNRLGGGDGAKVALAAWTRLGAAVGVPSAYFWFRNHEPENKADFDKVPSWERDNYLMIPRYDQTGAPLYFTNPQGEKVREYWRIPKRESTATISNMTGAALDFANTKDPGAVAEFAVNMLEHTFPLNISGDTGSERIESVKGSLTPLIKVPMEVTSNRDFFRHRDVVPQSRQGGSPENEFYAGSTPESYVKAAQAMPQFLWDPLRSPLMLQHIVSSTTGGFINQFAPNKSRRGERDESTAALAANPVGRVFVKSAQNDNSEAEKDVGEAKRGVRDRQIKLSNDAAAAIEAITSMTPEQAQAHLTDLASKQPEIIDAIAGEMEKRSKGFNSADRVAATLPIQSGERAAYLFKQLVKKPKAEQGAYLEDQLKKGILTEAVLEQLVEQIAAGRN